MQKTINAELLRADIILFLLSNNAFATNYIWDVEVKRALERKEENEEIIVRPIILSDCVWEGTKIGKFAPIPPKQKPVSTFRDRNKAWRQIVLGIMEEVNKIKK